MTVINSLAMPAETVRTPDFMIRVNSENVTGNISPRLISLTMTDNRGFESDQLDIELDDADGQR